MAMTPERAVKERVVKVLKKHDAYYFFPATHGYGRSGVPDIVCCVEGNFLAIECKAGKGKTTTLQEFEIEKIRKAGGTALVVNEDNVGAVSEFIRLITTTKEQP
jgi:Holliday junction resolvase